MYIRLGFRPNYGKRKRGGFLQVRDIMNPHVVSIDPTESAALAARLLARHNVGSLPVCGSGGQLQGMVTDRDIVLRCVAAEEDPRSVPVRSIMSRRPAVVTPEDDVRQAARLMSSQQVRRLPVVDKDRVVGVVSLGDLAKCGRYEMEISRALTDISENIRQPWNRGRGENNSPSRGPGFLTPAPPGYGSYRPGPASLACSQNNCWRQGSVVVSVPVR